MCKIIGFPKAYIQKCVDPDPRTKPGQDPNPDPAADRFVEQKFKLGRGPTTAAAAAAPVKALVTVRRGPPPPPPPALQQQHC